MVESKIFEEAKNLQKSIREYREFFDRSSPYWKDQINQIFNLLGFSTEYLSTRLVSLSDISDPKKKIALMVLIKSDEDHHAIIEGIRWDEFLRYVCSHYLVKWAILTDGDIFQVYDMSDGIAKEVFNDQLDPLLVKENFTGFISFVNIFARVIGVNELKNEQIGFLPTIPRVQKQKSKQRVAPSRYDSIDHLLEGISDQQIQLFERLQARVIELNTNIVEKYLKQVVVYQAPKNFCEVVILKYSIRIFLDIPTGSIIDPFGICRNIKGLGHWGSGTTEVYLHTADQVDQVMDLIRQSYDWNQK